MPKTQTDYINKIKSIKTGYLDSLWSAGSSWYEESSVPVTWLNCEMLKSSAILANLGEATQDDIDRAVLVVDGLFGVNCYNVTGNGTWKASLNNAANYQDIHEAQDQAVAEALYYAWKYRVALGLSAGQITSISNALTVDETTTIYGGNTLALGTIKDNQNLAKWILNRLIYGKLVLGDNTFDAAISTSLKNFIDYMDTNFGTPNTGGNTLTALFADYGWRYIEDMTWPSFEYGAMSLGGSLIFYPEISTIASLTDSEILSMKAWQRRLFGQWTHSGYPNWDTIWSWGRIHILQYWIWSLRMLLGIARNGGLNQNSDDYKYAKYMIDAAIDLHTNMDTWSGDASDGAVASDPYGLTHTGILGVYNNLKSVGNSKLASELALAVELGIPAVASLQPGNIWSYGQIDKAIHVSTPIYSACSLPSAPQGYAAYTGSDYVQCQNWGVSRIAAGTGRILTSLGGYGQETFSLEIWEGESKVFSTSSTANTQPAVQRINLDDSDIENRTNYMASTISPIFTSKLHQVCRTNGEGNYFVQIDTTFFTNFIRAEYVISRLVGAGAIDIIVSIPLRKTAVVEYYDSSLNKTTLWDRPTLTNGASPAPSACRYIHAKWAAWSQGLLVVPRRARVLSGAVATMSQADPSTYAYRQPDQDRSILLYLANDSTDVFQAHMTLDFILTDGTDGDAESKFSSLPSLPVTSSTEVNTWL